MTHALVPRRLLKKRSRTTIPTALAAVLDSLAGTGQAFWHIPDVETTDFSRLDTLTRGQETVKAIPEYGFVVGHYT